MLYISTTTSAQRETMYYKESLPCCGRLSLLGYPDSNQERQDQNLQCYHYTISQCRTDLLSVLRCNSYCFFVNNQNFSAVFCLAALFFCFSVQNSMFRQFLTIIFRTLLP